MFNPWNNDWLLIKERFSKRNNLLYKYATIGLMYSQHHDWLINEKKCYLYNIWVVYDIREGGETNKVLDGIRQNYAIIWYDFSLINDGVKRLPIFELGHIYALVYII